MDNPNLKGLYIETLLDGSQGPVPARDSAAFQHLMAHVISSVDGRTGVFGAEHRVPCLKPEDAEQLVLNLVHQKGGRVLPALQPYRPLFLGAGSEDDGEAQLKETSPNVTDKNLWGYEATARGLIDDGRVAEAGRMFWDYQGSLHADLDLEVLKGAALLGARANILRTQASQAPLVVSTNATPPLLARAEFAREILDVLKEARLSPDEYILEILEGNDLREDTQRKLAELRKLIEAGVKLSLDDLGRGPKHSDGTPFSIANLRLLAAEGVALHEVKFDGNDTIDMLKPEKWPGIEVVLQEAHATGVKRVVWEGFWKGFGMNVIKEVRRFHTENPTGRLWTPDQITFEGTVI